MTNQLEAAKEWLSDLNKIIDKTDNECTKQKRDVLEWLVESVEELERKHEYALDDLEIFKLNYKEKRLESRRYKQALEFYAKPGHNNWEFEGYVWASEVMKDNGKTARKALKGKSQ